MTKTLIVVACLSIISCVIAWWPEHQEQAATATEQTLMNAVPERVAPDAIHRLSVTQWPPHSAAAETIEAQLDDGMWLISSHHDFPADLSDRIGDVIGAVINLKQGPLVSGDPERHAEMRILDPRQRQHFNTTAYGQRIVLRDQQDHVVVDLIFGRYDPLLKRSFVRHAGDSNVYSTPAYVYLQADWLGWVKRKIIEHQLNQIDRFVIQAFAGKASQEQVTFSYNRKLNTWTCGTQTINQQLLRQYVDYLVSVQLYDVLPLNEETLQRMAAHGMQVDGQRMVDAVTRHAISCADGSHYEIFISNAFDYSDRFKAQYLYVRRQAGDNASSGYQHRYEHFTFLVSEEELEPLLIVPRQFLPEN